MFWKAVHDTLKWVGVSFFPAIAGVFGVAIGVAGVFPETKPWLVARFDDSVDMTHSSLFWLLGFAVFVAWLSGLIYSAHKLQREKQTP